MVNLSVDYKIKILFNNLFEHSDKITNVSNNCIKFKLDDTEITLSYVRTSNTNCSINVDIDKDCPSIWCMTYSWGVVKNENPKRFVIEILNKTYAVPEMDRVSFATYVDKFEQMIVDYHYNKIQGLIDFLSPNEEF